MLESFFATTDSKSWSHVVHGIARKVQWLSIACLLVWCIVCWFYLFGLGSSFNSEQFRSLLNLASVETVYDVAEPIERSPDLRTTQPSGAAGERSWSELQEKRYRAPKSTEGRKPPFNPDRVELVMRKFFGFSPGFWMLVALSVITYSPTNLAALSCLAGMIGGAALWLGCSFPTTEYGLPLPPKEKGEIPVLRTLLRGLATGFVVYLVIVAGLLVVTGTPFKMEGPDDYVRLTGTLSLFSLILALRPRLFFSILDKLKRNLSDSSGGAYSPDHGHEEPGKSDSQIEHKSSVPSTGSATAAAIRHGAQQSGEAQSPAPPTAPEPGLKPNP